MWRNNYVTIYTSLFAGNFTFPHAHANDTLVVHVLYVLTNMPFCFQIESKLSGDGAFTERVLVPHQNPLCEFNARSIIFTNTHDNFVVDIWKNSNIIGVV